MAADRTIPGPDFAASPRPAAPDFLTRAEAEAMAKEAASIAVKQVMDALSDGKTAAPDDQHFARGLAMALAEISNQGTGKKVVDPATLERRSKARERMVELIIDARREKLMPQYELTATVHLHDQLVVPMWTDNFRVAHRTRIKWQGVPNEAMLPVPEDATAQAIYAAFCESIGKAPGTRAMLMPVDSKGNMITPGGHVFESLPAIPKDLMDGGFDLEVEAGALPPRDTPHTGLEVLGGAPGGRQRKEIQVPVLGSIVEPARQLVA